MVKGRFITTEIPQMDYLSLQFRSFLTVLHDCFLNIFEIKSIAYYVTTTVHAKLTYLVIYIICSIEQFTSSNMDISFTRHVSILHMFFRLLITAFHMHNVVTLTSSKFNRESSLTQAGSCEDRILATIIIINRIYLFESPTRFPQVSKIQPIAAEQSCINQCSN